MRQAKVYCNKILAGTLIEKSKNQIIFRYDEAYFSDATKRSVSLTLPKKKKEYKSTFLFPFFSNMIAEGENKKTQSRILNIEEDDQFGLLLSTARYDTIGNITIIEF